MRVSKVRNRMKLRTPNTFSWSGSTADRRGPGAAAVVAGEGGAPHGLEFLITRVTQ